MGKLVVSLDGVVIKEVQITKDKTTLGRRPYNDIVIDNLAVSGEHAVLQMVGNDVFIEDLNSTNGTYINGKAIKKQLLADNDTVEIGKYKIKFLLNDGGDYEKTMILKPGGFPPVTGTSPSSSFGSLGSAVPIGPASIKVLTGAAAGRAANRGSALVGDGPDHAGARHGVERRGHLEVGVHLAIVDDVHGLAVVGEQHVVRPLQAAPVLLGLIGVRSHLDVAGEVRPLDA